MTNRQPPDRNKMLTHLESDIPAHKRMGLARGKEWLIYWLDAGYSADELDSLLACLDVHARQLTEGKK